MDKIDSSCGRKRRAQDDAIFERGNRVAFQQSGAIFYVEERYDFNVNDAVEVNVDKKLENSMHVLAYSYPCCVPGCTQTFHTISECEEHFDEQHMYQCGECHKVMPSNHLLELHLQEVHDSYFRTCLEKQQASYTCLVESCGECCTTAEERLLHLRKDHGYPLWFRWSTLTQEERQVLKKKQVWAHNHHKHSIPPKTLQDESKLQVDDTNTAKTRTRKRAEQRAKRREKQKQIRSTIPCRYYLSKEGCWRGDSCMFLHGNEVNEDVHMMDCLASDMEQLTVPDKISFGRRQRGMPH